MYVNMNSKLLYEDNHNDKLDHISSCDIYNYTDKGGYENYYLDHDWDEKV